MRTLLRVLLTVVCAAIMLAAMLTFTTSFFFMLLGQPVAGAVGVVVGMAVFGFTSRWAPKW